MAALKLIFIGALKNSKFKPAQDHYLEALAKRLDMELLIIKDAPGDLPVPERIKRESQAILKALGPKDRPVCLDERGKTFDSPGFSKALFGWIEDPGRKPCFIVGGAYGLSSELRALSDPLLSLGPYTLPHELARVVLLEQLYRAEAIKRGAPYHHA